MFKRQPQAVQAAQTVQTLESGDLVEAWRQAQCDLRDKYGDLEKQLRQRVLDQAGAAVATTQHYADWVEGCLNSKDKRRIGFKENIRVSFSDRPMGQNIFIISRDMQLPEFSGGQLQIIVPKQVSVEPVENPLVQPDYRSLVDRLESKPDYRSLVDRLESKPDFGNSKLYFMEDHKTNNSAVILYSDTVEELKRRGHSMPDLVRGFGLTGDRAFVGIVKSFATTVEDVREIAKAFEDAEDAKISAASQGPDLVRDYALKERGCLTGVIGLAAPQTMEDVNRIITRFEEHESAHLRRPCNRHYHH